MHPNSPRSPLHPKALRFFDLRGVARGDTLVLCRSNVRTRAIESMDAVRLMGVVEVWAGGRRIDLKGGHVVLHPVPEHLKSAVEFGCWPLGLSRSGEERARAGWIPGSPILSRPPVRRGYAFNPSDLGLRPFSPLQKGDSATWANYCLIRPSDM